MGTRMGTHGASTEAHRKSRGAKKEEGTRQGGGLRIAGEELMHEDAESPPIGGDAASLSQHQLGRRILVRADV